MLDGLAVLVVEDEFLVALDLTAVIEELGGVVIGPVTTVVDALALLQDCNAAGAILDANLLDRDVTPVAILLVEKGVPFVIHTGTGLPEELKATHPHLPVIMKPAPMLDVVQALALRINGS
jgi:CheY-like chemotaxis protein